MNNIKKILIVFLAISLVFAFTACSAKTDNTPESTNAIPTESTSAENAETPVAENKTLVIYFSATGNTKGVAEKIAAATNGDLYEIIPAEPYVKADLDYNNDNCRATKEQRNKSVRPEIANNTVNLDGFDTIYIGYPIWWGEEPRIMDTFVEAHSFEGKTVIPFCTSGSSGIGQSGKNLANLAKTGNWLDGDRLSSGISESELREFLDKNK